MNNSEQIVAQGLLLLALTYLSALSADHREPVRRVLAWIGGITLIPLTIAAIPEAWWGQGRNLSYGLLFLGKGLGVVLPLLLAVWLRRRGALINALAAVWILVLGFISPEAKLTPYIWAAIASLGLITWGVKESRRERINLGVLG